MNGFLRFVSLSSRVVAALIIALAYYALFSFYGRYVDFITTIPVYFVSLLVVEGLNYVIKNYYETDESELVHHMDSHEGFIINKTSKQDNRLEVAIILLIVSIIIFFVSYFSVLISMVTGGVVDDVYRNLVYYAILVFVSYITALYSLYFIVKGRKKTKNRTVPVYYLLFALSVGVFSNFLIDSILLLWGY
jgi:hypothetical protein